MIYRRSDVDWHRFRLERALFLGGIAVAAVALGVVATAGKAPAQTTPAATAQRTLTIAGDGEVRRNPDVAYVDVSVQTQAATAAEATAENSRRMTAVLAAMRERGVASQDLQTSGLYTSPQYDRSAPSVIVGYEANNRVTVTVNDLESLPELLNAALAAGANRIQGLRFGIRDSAALRQEALTLAGRSARARAEALAAGLGVRIVGLSSVQSEPAAIGSPAYPSFPEIPAIPAPGATPQPPPVESGELRVSARVQAVFQVE
jgi:uncharacterized protein YggE